MNLRVLTATSEYSTATSVAFSFSLVLLLDDSKKFSILKKGIGTKGEKIMETS